MTIRKGEAWGVPTVRPAGLPTAHTDAALAAHVGRTGAVEVTAGDLHRTLGSPRSGRPDPMEFSVDALRVKADDRELVAVAHVVARRSWWFGPLLVAMNAEWMGEWDVAPRGHPNDRRLELFEVSAAMGVRARAHARRRLPLGTHVPHPDIATASVEMFERTFAKPTPVHLDGRCIGRATTLRVTVEPDALRVIA